MNMLRSIGVFIVLVLLLAYGCEKDPFPRPKDLIPEDEYIKLMVDVQLFDAFVYTTDSLANEDSLRNALFDHYHTDEQTFLRSHYYYQSKIREHNTRLDSALDLLKREQKKLHQPVDSSASTK